MGELSEKRALHPAFRPARDYLFALVPLLAMGTYLYGWRVPILAGISLATAFVCDILTTLATSRRYEASDLSSYMYALIFTVMLPATASYHMLALGTAVTVLLGKQAFGGYGGYPFHPSAFGYAFTAVCFQDTIFKYPKPFSQIGLGITAGDVTLYGGVSSTLRLGGVPEVDAADLLIGNYQSPIGTAFCAIILACGALLIARGTVSLRISLSYLLTCAAFAYALPRISATPLESLTYEMLSGAVIFAAVFIVAVPSLSPKQPWAKVFYGIAMGCAVTLFRRLGYFEMGVCFATLLVNPLTPWFDRVFAPDGKKRKKKKNNASLEEGAKGGESA